MKMYGVFLASILLGQSLGAYVIKEQNVCCAGDNYILTLYSNDKKSENSLCVSKVLSDGTCRQADFYDQTGEYKVVVKSFAWSSCGALSLFVPFEDGYDYQTTVNLCNFDKLCQHKNKKNMNDCFITLSHDKFYKTQRS
jgi:hypothetical protein